MVVKYIIFREFIVGLFLFCKFVELKEKIIIRDMLEYMVLLLVGIDGGGVWGFILLWIFL